MQHKCRRLADGNIAVTGCSNGVDAANQACTCSMHSTALWITAESADNSSCFCDVHAAINAQRLGGHADGFWFTESFIAEGEDWDNVIQYGI